MHLTLSLLRIVDTNDIKDVVSKISSPQNMNFLDKPNIYRPITIFHTFFGPTNHKYEEIFDLLKNTIARYKDLIDSEKLGRADLPSPNPQESISNNDESSVSGFINSRLRDANNTSSELREHLGKVSFEE